MSQKNATELCKVILKEIYGDLASQVASVLLEFGRLNLPSIVKHTNLNVNIVKQTLVVLIQLHLVTHFTSGAGPREEVYYESAWENIYSLIHSGRIITVAEERFGPEGAWVISNMLELGHVRVKDFLTGSGLPSKPIKESTGKGTKAATNGTSDIITASPEGRPATLAQLKTIMTELLKNRFLSKVEDHHMHPKTDVVNALRLTISTQVKQNHGSNISDIKLKKLVDDKMAEKMLEMEVGDTSEHAGMKRKMADVGVKQTKRPNKRVKLANDFEDVNGKEEVWEIDEDIIVRVNHERFLIIFRNRELVALAEKRLGKVTAAIYSDLLRALESKMHRLHDPEDFVEDRAKAKLRITTFELSKVLSPEINLENTIAPLPKSSASSSRAKRARDDAHTNGTSGKSSRKASAEMDEDDISSNDDDLDDEDEDMGSESDSGVQSALKQKRLAILREHLSLLASSSSPQFLQPVGLAASGRGAGEWMLPIHALAQSMAAMELDAIITQRFGPAATRLVRILRARGRLDEKLLAQHALAKPTSIRSTLSLLQEAGFLELQELPKTAERAAARSLFLWYWDSDRARLNCISNIYKAMSRTLQRLGHERGVMKPLLDKSEREDVKGREQEFLEKHEIIALQKFRTIEERLLVQVARMTKQVGVLGER